MRIGQLAERTGVSRDTLRFYEKRGLIRSIRRPNGYRHFPEETQALLSFILTARTLGFTLAEIEEEMPSPETGISAEKLGELLRGKMHRIDERISELNGLRSALAARLDKICPLVAPL